MTAARTVGASFRYHWANTYGTPSTDKGSKVAADSSGNTFITGTLGSNVAVNFGGGAISGPTGNSGFLVKLAADGSHLWSKRWQGGNTEPRAISVTSAGSVLVTGQFSGQVDFGGGPLTSAGSEDIFVVQYDSTGAHEWSKRFGTTTLEEVVSLAVSSSGMVYLTGRYTVAALNFGGGALPLLASENIFVAALSPTGTHQWSRGFSFITGYGYADEAAVDATGSLVIVGNVVGTIDFGTGVIGTSGHNQFFATKFDPNGTASWVKVISGLDVAAYYSVGYGPSGDIYVGGMFGGPVDFGGGVVTPTFLIDAFVLKLNASGTYVAVRKISTSSTNTTLDDLVVDSSGTVSVVGGYSQTLSWGGVSLAHRAATDRDIFICRYDASLAPYNSVGIGGVQTEQPSSVAVAGNQLVLSGKFTVSTDLGFGLVSSVGGDDLFVVRVP